MRILLEGQDGKMSARKRDWMSQTKKIVDSGASLATVEGDMTMAAAMEWGARGR